MSLTNIAKLSGLSRKGVLIAATKLEEREWFKRILDGTVTVWTIILDPELGRSCPICGAYEIMGETANMFVNHHIHPKGYGGSNKKDNLITICQDCHNLIHTEMRDAISNGQDLTNSFCRSLLTRHLQVGFPIVPPYIGVSTGEHSTPPDDNRLPQDTTSVKSVHHTSEHSTPPSIKETIKEKQIKKKERGTRPPSVELCKRIVYRFPHKSLWKTIDWKIGRDFISLLRWGRLLRHWKLQGWNPTNFKAMLDAFSRNDKDNPLDYDSEIARQAMDKSWAKAQARKD